MAKAKAIFIIIRQAKAWSKIPELLIAFNFLNIQLSLS